MKRDRLGRFLSPGLARQRGGAGSGRVRGRPARGDGAETLAAAARLGWGSARACGDPVEDGADEAGSLGRRVKAKKPRRLKNQKCGRNLGPSLDGRKSSGVREVRNYICDECGQTFKQRKHLLVHQMRHSGAKPLQCEVCGFQCRQRASLKYHMTKHKAETELDFACDQCGRRFEKAHNLNVHMSMVHPLTQTQDKTLSLEAEPPPGPPSPPGITEGQAVKPEPT